MELATTSSRNTGWPIDHAPLFPPALLSPADALAAHTSGAESDRKEWLNALVWPFSKIHELTSADDGPHDWVEIALLITQTDNEQPEQVRELATELGPRLKHIESAVFPDVALLTLAATTPIFVEVGVAGATAEQIDRSLDEIRNAESPHRLHAKVRCGGSPAQVPTSTELATFIHLCELRGMSWKATAGLHDGTPRLDDDHPHHGLVNVISAAAAATRGASILELATLLEDTSPPPLTEDTLSAAAETFKSLGSCSFEEPLEALEANQNNDDTETHQ